MGWVCCASPQSRAVLSAWACLGVGVGSLLLAEGGHHVHEATVVLDSTLGAPRLLLLLLLLVHLVGNETTTPLKQNEHK